MNTVLAFLMELLSMAPSWAKTVENTVGDFHASHNDVEKTAAVATGALAIAQSAAKVLAQVAPDHPVLQDHPALAKAATAPKTDEQDG